MREQSFTSKTRLANTHFCYFRCRLFENLRMLPHAPGVQMSNIPEDSLNADDKAEADKENPDERISRKFNLYDANIVNNVGVVSPKYCVGQISDEVSTPNTNKSNH